MSNTATTPRTGRLRFQTTITRGGIVMEPDGSPAEAEGVLNPGGVIARDGTPLLYPRMVAEGNRSRIGIARLHRSPAGSDPTVVSVERLKIALEPSAEYELRESPSRTTASAGDD